MNTTFRINIYGAEQLSKIQTFLKENPEFTYTTESFNHTPVSYSYKYNYIPNYEFVGLCGSENLTKDGYISEEAAIYVILSYSKQKNLYFEHYIELNEYLQNALKTNNTSILIQDLPILFKNLFKQVL